MELWYKISKVVSASNCSESPLSLIDVTVSEPSLPLTVTLSHGHAFLLLRCTLTAHQSLIDSCVCVGLRGSPTHAVHTMRLRTGEPPGFSQSRRGLVGRQRLGLPPVQGGTRFLLLFIFRSACLHETTGCCLLGRRSFLMWRKEAPKSASLCAPRPLGCAPKF